MAVPFGLIRQAGTSLLRANVENQGKIGIFGINTSRFGSGRFAGTQSGINFGFDAEVVRTGEKFSRRAKRLAGYGGALLGAGEVAGTIIQSDRANKRVDTNTVIPARAPSSFGAFQRANPSIGSIDPTTNRPFFETEFDQPGFEPELQGIHPLDTVPDARAGIYIRPRRKAQNGVIIPPKTKRDSVQDFLANSVQQFIETEEKRSWFQDFTDGKFSSRKTADDMGMDVIGRKLTDSEYKHLSSRPSRKKELEDKSGSFLFKSSSEKAASKEAEKFGDRVHTGFGTRKPQLEFLPPEAKCGIHIPRRGRKARGGVLVNSVQQINGPEHEGGGVDIRLNGKPIEAEGGEFKLSFTDGSKAVFNKEQYDQFQSGVPVKDILKTIPKAANGVVVDPKKKNTVPNLSDPSLYGSDFLSEFRNELANIYEGEQQQPTYLLGNIDRAIVVKDAVPAAGISPRKKIFSEEEESRIFGTTRLAPFAPGATSVRGTAAPLDVPDIAGGVSAKADTVTLPPKDEDFFDQYNKNLIGATIAGGASSIGQGLAAFFDERRNRETPGPRDVSPVKFTPTSPRFLFADEEVREIDRNTNAAINIARSSGRPEQIPVIIRNANLAKNKVRRQISKINTAEKARVSNLDARGRLSVDVLNKNIEAGNIGRGLAFDRFATGVIATNREAMNRAGISLTRLGSDFATNRLMSDVLRKRYGDQMEAEEFERLMRIMGYK